MPEACHKQRLTTAVPAAACRSYGGWGLCLAYLAPAICEYA